jgi:hypothetical protein
MAGARLYPPADYRSLTSYRSAPIRAPARLVQATVARYASTIQPVLTDAGTGYVAHVRTNRTWGSQPEAHAIASAYNFKTHIFEIRGGILRLLSEVGTGVVRNFSLLWADDHYKVLTGGLALNGQAYAAGAVAYDPPGDGNCMYAAMFYIVRMGTVQVGAALQDEVLRAAHVANMRTVAAANLGDAMANILGEELQNAEAEKFMPAFSGGWLSIGSSVSRLYNDFPPELHYIQADKKGEYFIYTRVGDVKGKSSLDSVLEKTFLIKDRKERANVVMHVARDRSYFSAARLAEKPVEADVVEYPFPLVVPKLLYRWCSTGDGKEAAKNGITKTGGVHDGIPTMPNLISKDFARAGGGVGIVDASRCLQIDTSLIPEIAGKKPNSINSVKAKGGAEYKILVTIPARAISDITAKIK